MSEIALSVKAVASKLEGKLPMQDAEVISAFAASPEAKNNVKPLNSVASFKQNILTDMRDAVRQLYALRGDEKKKSPIDISFGEYVKERWGIAQDAQGGVSNLLEFLGVDFGRDSVQSLMNAEDFPDGYRWLVPELIREPISLGLNAPALWPNYIAAEQNISQPKIITPYINPADAMPYKIGEAESFRTGTMTFGQKEITLQKIGIGIKITDEVNQYVPFGILSVYLMDMGKKLNMAMDVLAIDTLINGDSTYGGATTGATTVGVTTTNTLAYKDILRAWIKMGIIQRTPGAMLANADMGLDVMMLDEFKGYGNNIGSLQGANPDFLKRINVRTPIPASTNMDFHGAMAANQLMLVDTSAALMKFNSVVLRVESERIVEKGLEATYANLTTGFANLFDEARLIIDRSVNISTNGFPASFDGLAYLNQALR